jgi:homoserine O-succinyltransferase
MITAKPLRAAIIDLYNGIPNQGMRCIKNLVSEASGRYYGVPIEYEVFDARQKGEIPDLSFDIYISTGGPGSPFDSEGKTWEKNYFNFLDDLWSYNAARRVPPKYGMFICHSYQMVARHFRFAEVTERRSQAFGVYPVHLTEKGASDPLFRGLNNPFIAADFREWQVLQPRKELMQEMGAEILCLEKERPHVDLERAVMGIRLLKQMVALQFHPEADPEGMLFHFSSPEQKEKIISEHGEKKYDEIIRGLSDPQCIEKTHQTVIPGFLRRAVENNRPELVEGLQANIPG